MRVLIRADASRSIGSGHIARCLALAEALRKQGHELAFVCRLLPGHSLDRLQQQGFKAFGLEYEASVADIETLLPWQTDIAAMQQALAGEPPFDWLIVDHYGLAREWEQAARAFASRIMAIDDLANRFHAVDLLLDQNFSATSEAYAPWIDPPCETLLGPRFALLREAFQLQHRAVRGEVKRVLVNFGGFDPSAQTYEAMKALAAYPQLIVDFVAGTDNPGWQAMQSLAEGHPNWRLHEHVAEFAQMMSEADLFIGAGGGTTWERAVLGLPSICIAVAANQQRNAELLAEAGVHLYLGRLAETHCQQLQQAIGVLIDNPGLQHSLATRSRQLVDGLGIQRVCVALSSKFLALREAKTDDSQLLFKGRNAEGVRRWSFNDAPIDQDSHHRWFSQSLNNPERLLLIGEAADGPVGVLRYDRTGERVEVSIYLFQGRGGFGWGRALLQQGEVFLREHWPQTSLIEAQVMPGNLSSLSLFRSAGYVQADCHFQRVLSND
jgi:UDP-2,4-diacetamido-2,4,6-trideoxy-beta-L-altropyranose hydrolase